MPRFWAYIGDKVQGPMEVPALSKVSGFNLLTQVCEEGAQSWRMADEVIEIKSYLLAPPRPNSFALDAGNAAPKLDLPPVPHVEELILPAQNMEWTKPAAQEKISGEVVSAASAAASSAPSTGTGAALRAVCQTCGYKNPRDVSLCMKCGEELKSAAPASDSQEKPAPAVAPKLEIPKIDPVKPAAAPAAVALAASASPATIDIPLPKLIALVSAGLVLIIGSFLGIRAWKKGHARKATPVLEAPAPVTSKAVAPKKKARKRAISKAPRAAAVRPRTLAVAAAPVVREKTSRSPAHEDETLPVAKTEEVPYHVVAEATPIKRKPSAAMNSSYTTGRRAEKTLWTAQEEQAIRQVQRNRIYGGLRTMERNAEVLMQILRDREYMTAFETGKRVYLYNDLDWSASMKDGPVYEVRLTFSGGREPDGAPKQPLRFAFAADLERGSVEPGGQDQLRSNTLHAFFDESRIAPEERRPIARDTEELVMAAQPGASPLALDTVVRQYAKVYTTAALSRVADAYNLALVKKKLAHDTRLGSEEMADTVKSGSIADSMDKVKADVVKANEEKTVVAPVTLKGSQIDFRMEKGVGRQRTFVVQAASNASPQKLWEVLTGYDRLKTFVPDMLTSAREGQDGAAIIVHTVYLTRFMFFVFKINLHLRVLERPREYAIQFERIAGEFESLRGSVEITTDPVTKQSRITFHANVVPTGRSMGWVIEKMGRRLLVPHLEAIRTKAESL